MQIINPNYSTLNAEQTAAIALNTTHRGSDGSDHSLSHAQNTDTRLDLGEPNEVSAEQAHNAFDAMHTQGTDTTRGTVTANIAMGGYNLTGAGVMSGGLDVIDVGEDTTLTAAQCLGTLCMVSGAYTVTLPAVSTVAEGANVTIYSLTAATIKVDLNDSDRFILDGTALTDAHMLDSESAAGDYVTVVKDSAVGWTVIGRSGTWTDGGTS